MSLYPDHKLKGTRKAWDKTALGNDDAGQVLRRYGVPEKWGDPNDAVAWFDDGEGILRILVADYSNGLQAELRVKKRGWSLSYGPVLS